MIEIRGAPTTVDPRFAQFDTSGLVFAVTRDPAKNHFLAQVDRVRR